MDIKMTPALHFRPAPRAGFAVRSAIGMIDSPPVAPALRFGRFELLARERVLRAEGVPVAIGARAFDVLLALARRGGDMVSAAELRRAVWGEQDVRPNNLRVQMTALRKLLGAGAIEHHAAHGYRLTLPFAGAPEAEGLAPATPTNLGPSTTTLYGRESELQRLDGLIEAQSRVTICGMAGVGKTAVAQAAAAQQRRRFADGVWWIELGALREGSLVAPTIAAALSLTLKAVQPVDELAHALGPCRLLLALDNCEHLADAVSHLADTLLTRAPGVHLLLTSRRPVRCAGEQLQRLDSLPLPDQNGLAWARRSGAVLLFEARARRADPRFTLTDANCDAVAAICAQLDGLPLALILAATRVPLLGVAALGQRLDDRLRLLSNREPDADGRHQTLLASLDWSHALLSPAEQIVLRRLGVFAGSFALDAAQALAGDASLDAWAVLEALQGLIDHALLLASDATFADAGSPRYTFHSTVRLYAQARLEASAEAEALRLRHARHFLAVASGPPQTGSRRPDKMHAHLPDADHDNVRAAQAWALENDLVLALQLAVEVNTFQRLRGHHQESRRIATRLLAHPGTRDHPRLAAQLHLGQCAQCVEQNDLKATEFHVRAALVLAQPIAEPRLLGQVWSWAGSLHLMRRDHTQAEHALEQALQAQRAAGAWDELSTTLNNLGWMHADLGRHEQARQVLEEALALNRRIDSTWGIAISLENLGESAYAQGDLQAAQRHWQGALELFRYLAQVLRRLGQPEAARARILESLRMCLPRQQDALVADAYDALAGVALDAGRAQRAAVLLNLAQLRRRGVPASAPTRIDLPPIEAGVRAALSASAWYLACAEAERFAAEAGDAEVLALAAA